MRIAIIADQHGELPIIPPCDLVILSGDITPGPAHVGGRWRLDLSDSNACDWLRTEFANWIESAPRVVAVAGNHDTCIEQYGFPDLPNVTYLQDSGCEFGGIKFWGTPWIRWFDGLAFNKTDDELSKIWSITPRADILVCHMPPYLDRHSSIDQVGSNAHVGSTILRGMIERVSPKLVTCGHIHEGRGDYQWGDVRIVNAARGFTTIDL